MSQRTHDTPYRDEPTASHRASERSRPAHPRRRNPAAHDLRQTSERQSEKKPPRGRSRRRTRGTGEGRTGGLTSHPTTRTAYVETRQWLLEQHGPVCAYCGRGFTASVMTLDHVAPRRGQTAYDRRDNLVLACPGCNMVKRDLAPMAFLLGARTRAANLLRYGAHLSPMLLDMARALAPEGSLLQVELESDGINWALLDDLDDGESPYRD